MEQFQEKYKLSRYNVFGDKGDVKYVWNTYSNALLKLDKNHQEYITAFSGIDDKSNEFNLLKSQGFIVSNNLNEFGRICLEERMAMFSENSRYMSFVILPGMGCNYNCSYCHQDQIYRSEVMTSSIAIEVAEYICNQLQKNRNIRKFSIGWFGGEPLLYLNIMEIISKRVIEYAQQNDIQYSARIMTNGRLIDAETIQKLQDFRIEWVHISVDGMRDLYCESKGASAEDFDNVIDNICYATDKMKVTVRLNIPNNDLENAIEITDFLLTQRGLQGKIIIYFSFIRDFSSSPDKERQAYINFTDDFYKWVTYVSEHYGKSEIKRTIPGRKETYCGLLQMNKIGIGPRGELYKCGHLFGMKAPIIGDIWCGMYFNDVKMYSTVDTYVETGCPDCEYLPICMGQCHYHRVIKYEGFDCEAYKKMQFKLKLMEG